MKRVLAFSLAFVMLFFSLPAGAEYSSSDTTAGEICVNLAGIYNNLLEYLEQRQCIWKIVLTAGAGDVDDVWFYSNMALADEGPARWAGIVSFFHANGYCSANPAPKDIFNDLFLPIYEKSGNGDTGLAKALFTLIRLVFYDDTLPEQMSNQKAAIKKLMTDSPDDPGLEAAQNLYKKVSMLLDYTNEGNDSFAVTEERIAGFQQTKRELKSEYTFDFDWPEADAATLHSIYEPYKSWIDEKKQGKARDDLNEETFTIGGSVFFGEWPTGAKGSSEAIEWIVLDVHENEILLISKYGLDLQPYHSEIDDAIWQNSSVRAWLNSTFYDNAFSATEKAAVKLTLVDNSAEQGQYDHDGGPNTEDHVFLLSYSEAMKYFASDEDRICNPTPYTRSKGAYLGKNGAGYWWLRSPCDKTFQRKAATVASTGIMWYIFVFDKDRTRSPIDPTTVMVRPAIRISVE